MKCILNLLRNQLQNQKITELVATTMNNFNKKKLPKSPPVKVKMIKKKEMKTQTIQWILVKLANLKK